MRLLTVILAIAGIISAALGQSVVASVKASGRAVSSHGIFDPRSSLEIQLSQTEIARLLAVSADDASVAKDLEDLTKLTELSKTGLRLLPKVAMKDPGAINELSTTFNAVGEVIRQRGYEDRLNVRLISANSLDPLVLTKLYFEEANILASEIGSRLAKNLPIVRVKLVLSRDPDKSRQPEQPFGVLPGEDSKKALSDFLGGLNLSQNPSDITPKALRDALVSQYKAKVQAEFGALKVRADDLFDNYKARISTIIAGSDAGQKDAWSNIQTGLDTANETWLKVRTEASELTSSVPSSQSEIEVFIGKASILLADVQTLDARLRGLKTGLDSAIAGIKPGVKADGDAVVALYSSAKSELKKFIDSALTSATSLLNAGLEMLNLVDHLQQIGETYKDTAKGFVRFENSNQQLEGLPAMLSYDEIRVEVYTKPAPPGESKKVGDSYPIYAWKPGRLDNITALGFYPKHGSNKWSATAILGQTYKFTLPNASFQTNRMLPGVGYGVTALDLDDDGQTEMGVGGILTLFDDHVVVSYGYNLAGKGTYWCLGYRFRL